MALPNIGQQQQHARERSRMEISIPHSPFSQQAIAAAPPAATPTKAAPGGAVTAYLAPSPPMPPVSDLDAAGVVELLSTGMQHDHWMVRDLVPQACIEVMQQRLGLDYGAIFKLLCSAMVDDTARVRVTALEAMAELRTHVGTAEVLKMIDGCGLKDRVKQQLRKRLEEPPLPPLPCDSPLRRVMSPTSGGKYRAHSLSGNEALRTTVGQANCSLQSLARCLAAKHLPESPTNRRATDGGSLPGLAQPSPSRQPGSQAAKEPAAEGGMEATFSKAWVKPEASPRPPRKQEEKGGLEASFDPLFDLEPRQMRAHSHAGAAPSAPQVQPQAQPPKASSFKRTSSLARKHTPSPHQQHQQPPSKLQIPEPEDPDSTLVSPLSEDASPLSYRLSLPLTASASEEWATSEMPHLPYAPAPPPRRRTDFGYSPSTGEQAQRLPVILARHPESSASGRTRWLSQRPHDDLIEDEREGQSGTPTAAIAAEEQARQPTSGPLARSESSGSAAGCSRSVSLENLKKVQAAHRGASASTNGLLLSPTSRPLVSMSRRASDDTLPGSAGGGGGGIERDRDSAPALGGLRVPQFNFNSLYNLPIIRTQPSLEQQQQQQQQQRSSSSSAATQPESGHSSGASNARTPLPAPAPPLASSQGASAASTPFAAQQPSAAATPVHKSGSFAGSEPSPSPPIKLPSSNSGRFSSAGAVSAFAAAAAATPTKAASQPSPGVAGAVAEKSGGEEVLYENLLPLRDPERALRSALAVMQVANVADRKELDWVSQNEALNDCRRLAKHHPSVVQPALHEIVAATLPAVDALRSLTAKTALVLYQEMFSQLGRSLDSYLANIAPMLLKRAAEVSGAGRENFLTLEARATLSGMCHNTSGARALSALMASAGHKAPNVRACVAQHMDTIVEAAAMGLGSWASPTSNWAFLERVFQTAVGFLNEGALETRCYGKRLLWHLRRMPGCSPRDLASLVSHLQPPAAAKKVQDLIDSMPDDAPPPPPQARSPATAASLSGGGSAANLSSRGPSLNGLATVLLSPARPAATAAHPQQPHPPSPTPFGLARPSPSLTGGAKSPPTSSSEVSTPVNRSGDNLALATPTAPAGPAVRAMDPTQTAQLLNSLSAKDFRERVEGLQSLGAQAAQLAAAPDAQVTALLDALTVRLGDGNSKVSTQALQTLGQLAEGLRERIAPGLHQLVPALAASLGAANDKARGAAVTAADKLVASVHPAFLVQHFAHCVAAGSPRARVLLVDQLEAIVNALAVSRPQLVVKYALPATVALAIDTKGGAESKEAATRLLTILARVMGPALLDHCSGLSAALQQRVAELVAAAQQQGQQQQQQQGR